MSSSERSVRGNHIIPLRDFIHEHYDAATQARIYDALSPETREMLKVIGPDDWRPMHMVSEMNAAIYEHSGDKERGHQDIILAGNAVALYATNTFMRLLIKLMSPEMLAKKWPTIWKKSHSFGTMDSDFVPDRERCIRLTLSDVENYAYIGPIAVGFLSFSLKAMGKEQARVELLDRLGNHKAGSYSFEITW